jgi:cyclophilin family peptidyl-prolyl cis-trans isomerase
MKNLTKIVLLLVFVAISSCKSTNYPNLNDGIYADIQTDKGSILLQLEYENTPITVANFVSLAEGNNVYVAEKYKGKPFYDGLKFHRVVENFIIQGGDPLGIGTGGPGYQFEDEFPTNDDGNLLLSHNKAGILSMANSGPDANGSQFFITHRQTMNLDGRHTVFGHVVDGQAIVDSIVKDDVMNTIKIVRVGGEAKKFDARQIFSNYFKKLEEVAKEKLEIKQKAKDDFLKLKDQNEAKAEILASGLKIYFIKKGEGEKPNNGNKVNVNYAGYFTTGDLFDSNIKDLNILFNKYDYRRDVGGGYNPVAMDYSPDARLIPGFKEGLKQMKVGDKVMLFIPSHLAYGPQGYGPIPPDTDLIYELEITNIVQ